MDHDLDHSFTVILIYSRSFAFIRIFLNFMNRLKYYVFPLQLTYMATESRYSTG